MQSKAAAKTSYPNRRFFLLGVFVELFLIAAFLFQVENWLAVQFHNFSQIVHFPLLILLESGLGATAPTTALTLLGGFAVMSLLWGFLISLLVNGFAPFLKRLDQSQRKLVWYGAVAVGLVCLVWAGIGMAPERQRPFVSSPETEAVVNANNAFALDLYHKLKDKPGNLFFSPYGVSSSLAMTSAGARRQTEMEMTNALHFSLPTEKLHPAFKSLTARLAGLERWNHIALTCANSLWCQQDHSFTQDYLKTIRENYSAEAKPVDFKNSSGSAAAEINSWIDAHTNHKIPTGIGPGQISPDTRLVLCDAIYFKGKWQQQFKKKDTKTAPFHIATNETVTVPTMYQSAPFKHAMTEDRLVEMLEMPYAGADLSMVILLPGQLEYLPDAERNDVHDLGQNLNADNLRAWLKLLDEKHPHKTSVWLPRFKTADSLNLKNELQVLGVTSAFSKAADFSGMDGATGLFLADVIHQAFVEVNETGTEATAMTLATAMSKGIDDRFVVDRPFIFLIRDNGSGCILFLGRIVDPTK